MATPTSFHSERYADNTIDPKTGRPETASFQVAISNLTPANVAAQITLINTLSSAVAALVIGNADGNEVVYDRNDLAASPAASPLAQRENKWLVTYQGDTSMKLFRLEIPTADLSGTHLLPNQDEADLADADIAAFVTAFEAIARSPDSQTETVTVMSIRHVGRNV